MATVDRGCRGRRGATPHTIIVVCCTRDKRVQPGEISIFVRSTHEFDFREKDSFLTRHPAKQQPRLGRSIRMSQHRGLLTPEERARIMQLQDLLIDRFVEHREATAAGQEERIKIVEVEIDGLLAEKAEIEKWAAVGSA